MVLLHNFSLLFHVLLHFCWFIFKIEIWVLEIIKSKKRIKWKNDDDLSLFLNLIYNLNKISNKFVILFDGLKYQSK